MEVKPSSFTILDQRPSFFHSMTPWQCAYPTDWAVLGDIKIPPNTDRRSTGDLIIIIGHCLLTCVVRA
ncbi:hypothetical protein VTN77DRAFT_943 [Rasamsonia byssochlamydoides]|uniref:uncharacterized protein n=1 Tax=Rasamsonia byssochlamydoides TaxID=89139 RepID=UPI00374343A8